jgi:hypothetical protein
VIPVKSKSSVIGILICFLSGFYCIACTTISERNSNSPRLQFEETIYDFGVAGQESEVTHNFVFKNVGNSPLKIEGLRTSCGCTAALLSEDTIAPGKTGIIHATFKTQKYEGKQKKFIYVESNDLEKPEIELVMQGSIKSDIAIDPQGLHFGNVSKGKTISKKVKVFDLGKGELQIERIRFNENFFGVKADKFKDQNNRGFELDITLRQDAPTGSFNEVITLHTNLERRPRIDIPVWGNIQ